MLKRPLKLLTKLLNPARVEQPAKNGKNGYDKDHAQKPELQISEDEKSLLANIVEFRGLTAKDIMVPRADIQAFSSEATLPALVTFFAKTCFDCIPIYRETLDDVIGVVYLRDLMPYAEKGSKKTFEIQNLVKDVLFVAPSIRIFELMIKMRASRVNMALVVDEFGGIDGLVTLEDVIEEIVGKIQEPLVQTGEPQLVSKGDRLFLADARISLDDLKDKIQTEFPMEETHEDVETLGGYLSAVVGRVPLRGELITLPTGYEFEIKDADPRRVKQVLIRLPISVELNSLPAIQ